MPADRSPPVAFFALSPRRRLSPLTGSHPAGTPYRGSRLGGTKRLVQEQLDCEGAGERDPRRLREWEGNATRAIMADLLGWRTRDWFKKNVLTGQRRIAVFRRVYSTSCRELCVSGVSVAGRKRCAKLERTKGAFFSGDPSLRFDAKKKNWGWQVYTSTPTLTTPRTTHYHLNYS